jgi:hypothetical protein
LSLPEGNTYSAQSAIAELQHATASSGWSLAGGKQSAPIVIALANVFDSRVHDIASFRAHLKFPQVGLVNVNLLRPDPRAARIHEVADLLRNPVAMQAGLPETLAAVRSRFNELEDVRELLREPSWRDALGAPPLRDTLARLMDHSLGAEPLGRKLLDMATLVPGGLGKPPAGRSKQKAAGKEPVVWPQQHLVAIGGQAAVAASGASFRTDEERTVHVLRMVEGVRFPSFPGLDMRAAIADLTGRRSTLGDDGDGIVSVAS